jgi:hypothetical protein
MIPGLTAMGSARASVWADDGICRLHDLIVSARDGCGRFSPRAGTEGRVGTEGRARKHRGAEKDRVP